MITYIFILMFAFSCQKIWINTVFIKMHARSTLMSCLDPCMVPILMLLYFFSLFWMLLHDNEWLYIFKFFYWLGISTNSHSNPCTGLPYWSLIHSHGSSFCRNERQTMKKIFLEYVFLLFPYISCRITHVTNDS